MSVFTNIVEAQTSFDHSLSFVVQGKAQVQQRPKVAFRNPKKTLVYYDPSSLNKKKWKKTFNDALLQNGINVPVFGSNPFVDKGIHLSMEIYISRPKSDFHVVKGVQMENTNLHLYPNTKDLDNMIKFYMDAMQNVAYKNDNVVTKLTCSKEFITDSIGLSTTDSYIVVTMKQLK
jgi:Holliday junction resolvase RusA-like endonuclease